MSLPHIALRVVSLPDADDRRARVAADLADLTLPWAFLDACRADSPAPVAPDPEAQRDRFGRLLTPGEVGCFKSHLAALAAFDDDPALDWLIVMEDDVWLDPALDYAALAAQAGAARIGCLRLFVRTWVPGRAVGRFGPRQLVCLSTDPYGTQAYMISRAAAAHFRAHVAERSGAIVRPIDDELGRFWEHGLDLFALFPFPAVEREGPSTLEAARDGAGRARAPLTLARRRTKLVDAFAKRAWLARRHLGLVGDGLSAGARHTLPPRPARAGPATRGG